MQSRKRDYIKELVLIWNTLQTRCWERQENGQFIELRYRSVRDVKDNKRVYVMSSSSL